MIGRDLEIELEALLHKYTESLGTNQILMAERDRLRDQLKSIEAANRNFADAKGEAERLYIIVNALTAEIKRMKEAK